MMSTAESLARFRPLDAECAARPLLLTGGEVALDASTSIRADVEIIGGRISRLIEQRGNRSDPWKTEFTHSVARIPVEGCLVLPGLINSHDHLEFNLFPRLGRGPYPNFKNWAEDIFRPDSSPVRDHLSISKRTRLWWGGLKNLLSGVTTVCHHNEYDESVFDTDFPVRVVNRYGWAHSLLFGKDIRRAFLSTPPDAPFIIHLGEGSDWESGNEIFELDDLGALDSRTVIVHGVGLTASGNELRRRRGAALVWCPTSNRFTLGTTLDPGSMNVHDRISLGSDSALTAEGDLLDEIRAAQEEGMDSGRVYSMVTDSAANVLRLSRGEGNLQPGSVADLIVVKWKGLTPAETLTRTRLNSIEMVMVSGRPQMLSATTALDYPPDLLYGFEEIVVERIPCFVRAPVRQLLSEARTSLVADVRLAGKRVEFE